MTSQNHLSFLVRALASVLSIAITLILMAVVFGNRVQPAFFPELEPQTESFGWLLGGMLLMGLLIAYLYPFFRIEVAKGWFVNALKVAVPFGLTIFFATHMVQAGYIQISATGWLLEGLYDSAAPMVAVVVLAWLSHRKYTSQERR